MSAVPFEEASADKTHAMQDYLDLIKASGGDISLLGSTASSAFLLWEAPCLLANDDHIGMFGE